MVIDTSICVVAYVCVCMCRCVVGGAGAYAGVLVWHMLMCVRVAVVDMLICVGVMDECRRLICHGRV